MNATSEAKAMDIVELAGLSAPQTPIRDYLMLAKPRLSSLVLLATLAGFFFGCTGQIDFVLLIGTLLGTALVACGASALNQVLEIKNDALMVRTQNRPLPTRRLGVEQVLYFGVAMGVTGMLCLALCVNLASAQWAALTLALYVFVYTPLKQITSLNTLVGAIPGALPPLIGFAAARGELNAQAWCLFAILFTWQLPHFLAIAWIYRQDYARAGFQMLPALDPEGFSTGRQIALHSLMLLPLSLLPFMLHMSGWVYLISAALMSVAFIIFALNFTFKRSDKAARQLFLASVAYLPLLLAVMMYDRN